MILLWLKWIDPNDLERARAAVRNEWEMRVGSSSSAVMRAIIDEAIHPEGHPYHHAHDNPEDVVAIKLSDVQWFFQKWYGPGNASLAVVGDFDVKAAQRTIEAMFGPVVQGTGPAQRPPARLLELDGQHEVDIEWLSKVRSCSTVWPVPADADEHDRALDVSESVERIIRGRPAFYCEACSRPPRPHRDRGGPALLGRPRRMGGV